MVFRSVFTLDGSKKAETVLSYDRLLAHALRLPIELGAVVDTPSSTAVFSFQRANFLSKINGNRSKVTEWLKTHPALWVFESCRAPSFHSGERSGLPLGSHR